MALTPRRRSKYRSCTEAPPFTGFAGFYYLIILILIFLLSTREAKQGLIPRVLVKIK